RSSLPRDFAFYVTDPSAPLKLARCPHSLAASLAALRSMSLIPSAPLKLARFPLSLVATSRLFLLCRSSLLLHSHHRRSFIWSIFDASATANFIQEWPTVALSRL